MTENPHFIYLPRTENEPSHFLNLATISQVIEYDDGTVVVLFADNERRLPISCGRAQMLISEILDICSIGSVERYGQSGLSI